MRKTDGLAIPVLSILICALLIISACEKGKNDPDPEIEVEEFPIKGSDPAWSPDGSKIAYLLSDSLYIIDIDGKNKQKLATVVWSPPAWSPNGVYILYTSSSGNMFRIKSDGSEKINLTNNSFYSHVPSWSPDGTKIAFVNSNLTGDLYLMNSDGSNTRKLITQNSSVSPYQVPDWTADGNTIMFSAGYELLDRDIYFIDSDGNNESRLIINTLYEEDAQLSVDGGTIYFKGSDYTSSDIFKVNRDGTGLVNLTVTGGNSNPQLSPDGSRIVYSSYLDNADGLYIMSSDGSNVRKIFDGLVFPVWSPDGENIAINAFINGVSYIYIINVPR